VPLLSIGVPEHHAGTTLQESLPPGLYLCHRWKQLWVPDPISYQGPYHGSEGLEYYLLKVGRPRRLQPAHKLHLHFPRKGMKRPEVPPYCGLRLS
jgi:hypothetical protein